MPEEKSVERHMCGVKKLNGYSQRYMSPAVQGDWVKHEDYARLQARLEEVEGERDEYEGFHERLTSVEDWREISSAASYKCPDATPCPKCIVEAAIEAAQSSDRGTP